MPNERSDTEYLSLIISPDGPPPERVLVFDRGGSFEKVDARLNQQQALEKISRLRRAGAKPLGTVWYLKDQGKLRAEARPLPFLDAADDKDAIRRLGEFTKAEQEE